MAEAGFLTTRPAMRAGEPPPGPVQLWFAVFTDDGELMGAEPVTRQPRWLWRDGCLCLGYSPLTVTVTRAGRFSTGLICAVSPDTGVFRPQSPLSLGPGQDMRAGNTITVADGVIAIHPELPGPHG